MNENKLGLVLIAVLWVLAFALPVKAQNQYQNFRLQHKPSDWKQYETKNAFIYCKKDVERLARIVVENLPDVVNNLEDSLGEKVNQRFHIIIYNSENEKLESNVGLSVANQNSAGTIEFTANRILLFYKGSKQKLIDDLYFELTKTIIQHKIYGSTIKEYLASITKGNYPHWIEYGLTKILSTGFSIPDDEQLRQFLFTGKPKSFDDLISWNNEIAGTFLFYYLSENYPKQKIVDLLRQLQTRKRLDDAFHLTYKAPLWWLEQSALAFYAKDIQMEQENIKTDNDTANFTLPIKRNTIAIKYSFSDGYMYFISRKENRIILCRKHFTETKPKTEKLLTFKSECITPPQLFLDYKESGHVVLFFYSKGHNNLVELKLDAKGRITQITKRTLPEIDGIIDLDFERNSHTVFFSGFANGKTDLYEYAIVRNRLSQITFDDADESRVCIDEGSTGGIYFTSNLKSDSIVFDGYKTIDDNKQYLHFISSTDKLKFANGITKYIPVNSWLLDKAESISHLRLCEDGSLTYLSNICGINIVWKYYKTLRRGSLLHPQIFPCSDYNIVNNEMTEVVQTHDSIRVYQKSLSTENVFYKTTLILRRERDSIFIKEQEQKRNELRSKEENSLNLFGPDSTEKSNYQKSQREERVYKSQNLKNYQLSLTSDYISAQLDNTLLFNRYQSYFFNQGLFHQPQIGGMMKYAFTDIFENHSFQFAFRVPSQAKGSDFYMQYRNNKKMLDWGITYFRHVEKFTLNQDATWYHLVGYYVPPYIKQKTHYLELELVQPFSTSTALSTNIGFRNDRNIYIATDTTSLKFKDSVLSWLFFRICYQMNRSREIIPFVRKGYSGKVFAEYHSPITKSPKGFAHIGLEAKLYQPVYRNCIWATKFNAATSGGGTSGILYSLGGQQNGIGQKIDSFAQFLPTDNYSYVSYVTNLRGYSQNIRYGNTYVLVNSELRIPVLNTLHTHKTRFVPLNHLQFVPFIDMGTAWKAPLREQAKIPKLAIGYGIGARTTLLDYFVRCDLAWQNVYQSSQKRPMVMFALGREW